MLPASDTSGIKRKRRLFDPVVVIATEPEGTDSCSRPQSSPLVPSRLQSGCSWQYNCREASVQGSTQTPAYLPHCVTLFGTQLILNRAIYTHCHFLQFAVYIYFMWHVSLFLSCMRAQHSRALIQEQAAHILTTAIYRVQC
jgi:hypothetical protein